MTGHPADVIDCDVHCAPESFEALSPYLSDHWRRYILEAGIRMTGVASAYPPGAATSSVPAGYDALRERVLDRTRPRHAVLNCLTGFETHRDPYYSRAIAGAVNDWVRDEFLERDDRLRASVIVSTVDPDDAVSEIERVGEDPRFVQVLLPVRSGVPWGKKVNHRIFEAAVRRDLRIALHAWGRAGSAATPSGFTATYLEDYLANQPIAQAQVLSLVCEGVFDRFPALRVLLTECGFSWLPSLLWRFDKDWKAVWREVPWVRERPSVYVHRHFRATTAPAHLPDDAAAVAELAQMLDAAQFLVYASDYPHEHGDGLDRLLAALGDDGREGVLRGNAASFYAFG
jgi:predicted TIM-barrel fold metal-dependent hydrolase